MKLAVGGCSFSDYRYGITPFGKRISEELDCDYIPKSSSSLSEIILHFLASRIITGTI